MNMTHTLTSITPAFSDGAIPVFFSTDSNFAPYLGVAIQSLISQSNPSRNYDIIIGSDHLSELYMSKIQQMVHQYPNISIRFYDLADAASLANLKAWDRFSLATFFRFFIPEMFNQYSKVIYLDVDICILRDIADLYDTDIHDAWLGACHDYGVMPQFDTNWHNIYSHSKEILGLEDPHREYFNSGVLLMNITQCRQNNIIEKLLESEAAHKHIFNDQDDFNKVCRGHVHYLDAAWNYSHPIPEESIPEELREAHTKAAENPYIAHYTAGRKPWLNPGVLETSHHWWYYARMTRFYEEILYRHIEKKRKQTVNALREIINLPRNRRKYWQYKIQMIFSCGKRKRRYKELVRQYRSKIKAAKRLRKAL